MAKHTEHDETALLAWAIGSDTGLSSKAMVQRIVIGGRPAPGDYPRDPADLGRCLRLIEAVPTLLIDLHMMRDVSPKWAGMVKAAERFNRGGITLFGNEEDVPITFKGKDFRALRAALTRIKGEVRCRLA